MRCLYIKPTKWAFFRHSLHSSTYIGFVGFVILWKTNERILIKLYLKNAFKEEDFGQAGPWCVRLWMRCPTGPFGFKLFWNAVLNTGLILTNRSAHGPLFLRRIKMSNKVEKNRKPEDTTKKQSGQKTQPKADDLDVCTSDPAWAEHARPNDEGPEPCDDGRGMQFGDK